MWLIPLISNIAIFLKRWTEPLDLCFATCPVFRVPTLKWWNSSVGTGEERGKWKTCQSYNLSKINIKFCHIFIMIEPFYLCFATCPVHPTPHAWVKKLERGEWGWTGQVKNMPKNFTPLFTINGTVYFMFFNLSFSTSIPYLIKTTVRKWNFREKERKGAEWKWRWGGVFIDKLSNFPTT